MQRTSGKIGVTGRSTSRLLIVCACAWALTDCNSKRFDRGAKQKVDAPPALPTEPESGSIEVKTEIPTVQETSISAPIAVENIADVDMTTIPKGGFDSKALSPLLANHIWIATAAGDIQHLILEAGAIKSKKSWTGATPTSGTRSYVLEGGGAVLAKNGGEYYFLHDLLVEGAIDKDLAKGNYFKLTGPAPDDRSCIVSYKRDGKRWLGIAYGLGYFVEVEQSDAPPYGPKWATAKPALQVSPVKWGYSCYIDQQRLQFYSQYFEGTTVGLNLKTMQILDLNLAPNAAFASSNLPTLTVGPKATGNGSYAMSGDRLGNVFNGKGYYTLAFEPKNNMVWGTSGTNLSIYPHECLYKTTTCVGFATYNLIDSIGTGVGPLSALGDGSMVGMVRGVGDVYLLKMKVPENATLGIEAVKIAEKVGNGGDPYMYTDFTGATLYLTNSLNAFDLSKGGKFDDKLVIRQLGFSWDAVKDASEEWKDIKAEIRCYASEVNKGDFTEVEITARAKGMQFVSVPSCTGALVSKAEVRLTQIGAASTLMGVQTIQLTAVQ